MFDNNNNNSNNYLTNIQIKKINKKMNRYNIYISLLCNVRISCLN